MPYRRISLWISLFALVALSCRALSDLTIPPAATATPTALPTATPLRPVPVRYGAENPAEPVYITGEIPYTSPFFVNSLAEPFVMLEDQAGFVQRDKEFQFRLQSQAIGPVEQDSAGRLTYGLALPAIPQGTFVDVDNNGEENDGVQVFAVAYWSNTWGDPFLEERDGTGWSTGYASTVTDPENENEITGGILVIWAPDDQQAFPTGFGEDGKLFTADDPAAPIAAGYNLVDLSSEPFRVYKEARPDIILNEGEIAINDFASLDYSEAFDAFFTKVSREYPFTEEKGINWQTLYDEFAPMVKSAGDDQEFYEIIHDLTYHIPDAHVGMTFNNEVFYQQAGGSFGLVLAELSDGRVMVTHVLPDTAGENAGIKVGAELIRWDNQSVGDAISQVEPYLGPFSTLHARRLQQVVFLTRLPPGTRVSVEFQNPGEAARTVTMSAEVEYDSLFQAMPSLAGDELALPVEGEILDESGLGYIRINTFSEDYNLMAQLWDHYIQQLIDNEVSGLVIDIRANGGGSMGMALDFAGYFFDRQFDLYQSAYYNENLSTFKFQDLPARIEPGPLYYEGPVAVLVSPECISACEGFSYALQQDDRAIIVGQFPTAGAFGEVGRGQYKLPGDIDIQFPTGRPETMQGELLIEGVGVLPEITVPVSEESALGGQDTVLDAAIQALLDRIP